MGEKGEYNLSIAKSIMVEIDRMDIKKLSECKVAMIGITKRFPGVLANDKVNLYVKEGEIHAIVGENGAGKTTLMKQLYGLIKPDSGTIFMNGKKIVINTPGEAILNGIGMVHQHFMLVPPLTVAENIVLGMEPVKGIVFDINKAREDVKELSEKYALHVDPDVKIEDISVGMQQRVEILKTLYRGADLLILDEPTAVLTPQETEELFTVMKSLKKQGKTIIFITHKLNEVMAITDYVTVMRLGKVTGRVNTKDTNPNELARMMVGRNVLLRVNKKPPHFGKKIFEIKDLWVKDNRNLDAVKGLSLQIRKGEILGIAGVAGNGQSELVEAITGLRRAEAGKIVFDGMNITNWTPKQVRKAGIAHVTEDRLKYGLIVKYPISYNFILAHYDEVPYSNGGFLNFNTINTKADKLIKEFDVRTPSRDVLVGALSGGNQQKVIVAREFYFTPKFAVVAQPTRGLDIGAIEFIHNKILEMRDKGIGMLLVSMELEEIFSLSDRIAVMYEGEIMGIVKPEETTVETVGLMMAGARLTEIKADDSRYEEKDV